MTRPAAELPDAIPIVLACRTIRILCAVDRIPVDPDFDGEPGFYVEVSGIRLDNGVPAAHEDSVLGPGPLEPGGQSAERTTPLSIEPRHTAPDRGRRLQEARACSTHRQGPPNMPTDRGNERPCLRRRPHVIAAGGRTARGLHYGLYGDPTVAVPETDPDAASGTPGS
jgi:hypothetical protein